MSCPRGLRNAAGMYYRPGALREVVGLERVRCDDRRRDAYVGTAEALVASGLITEDMLPGGPDKPTSRCTYRPVGTQRDPEGWFWTPGVLTIVRRLDGMFRVNLVVSTEEQQRRRAPREAGAQVVAQPSRPPSPTWAGKPWPFEMVSVKDWDLLNESERGVVEHRLQQEIDEALGKRAMKCSAPPRQGQITKRPSSHLTLVSSRA